MDYNFEYILVDRTWLLPEGDERITIQKNPGEFKEQYPCWFFNKEKFENFFMPKYTIVNQYTNSDRLLNIDRKPMGILAGYLFKIIK